MKRKKTISITPKPNITEQMIFPKSSAKIFEDKIRSIVNEMHTICKTGKALYPLLDDINYFSKQINQLVGLYKTELGEK